MIESNDNAALEPFVNDDGSFKFYAPATFFEKAGAPEGARRRIGGLISTETRDRQNEVVIQNGLDFDQYLKYGRINDDHMKGSAGIIGVPDPDSLQRFSKGEVMPNGKPAPANGTWAEGWLLENEPHADTIWKKALAAAKSPRGQLYGFSIEGKIHQRAGRDKKTISKAQVLHLAVTGSPVNTDTRLDVLAKALTAGSAVYAPQGPASGEGAGRILAPESLEHDAKDQQSGRRRKKKKKIISKAETRAQAVAFVLRQRPQLDCTTAGRIVDLTLRRMGETP